jgi:hypothetical protein
MKKRVKTFNAKIETFDSIAVSCNNTPKYSTSFYAENRNILMKELRQNLRKRNICKPDLSKIMRTANEASTAYLNSSESTETTYILFVVNKALYRITFTCYMKRLKKTPPIDRVNARGENIFEKRLRQNGSDKLLHRYNEARKVANNLDIVHAARKYLIETLENDIKIEKHNINSACIDFSKHRKITIALTPFLKIDFRVKYNFYDDCLNIYFEVLNIMYDGVAVSELPPADDNINEEIVIKAENTAKLYTRILSLLN